MNLSILQQVDVGIVGSTSFDGILCASGYERRSRHLAEGFLGNTYSRRIALCFDDRPVLDRDANDAFFQSRGFTMLPCGGSGGEVVLDLVMDMISGRKEKRVSILIDYTSMTTCWYAAILDGLRSATSIGIEVEIVFVYSVAKYSTPGLAASNAGTWPVPGFGNVSIPGGPTTLIMGLGYERDRALGVHEYLEPYETYLFYTDPAFDVQYTADIVHNNSGLISLLPESHVFRYPASDLKRTGIMLSSLCSGLVDKCRIILVPLGPKPFVLLCLFQSLRMPQLEVWRVTGGATEEPALREPSGDFVVCKAVFSP